MISVGKINSLKDFIFLNTPFLIAGFNSVLCRDMDTQIHITSDIF